MNGMELGNPENNPFKPINETVYTYLYQATIGLEFKPGTLLVESKIAAELNVSRSPVKAALRRLERENLVEWPSGKSPRVAAIRYEDCAALLEARKAFESSAVYYAAGRITDDELVQLRQALLRLKIQTPVQCSDDYAKADASFHQLIVNASRNRYLIDAYAMIQSSLLRYRLYIMRRMDITELHEYEHHLPVYLALKNHCATLAREELLVSIEHMSGALHYL